MAIKAVYIDDENDKVGQGADWYRKMLTKPNILECELLSPPKDISDLPTDLDILLVDLDLNKQVRYLGKTLASEMRNQRPDCPIILITRPNTLSPYNQLIDESIDIDMVMLKDDIGREPELKRAQILALVEGFKTLHQQKETGSPWSKVVSNLLTENEEESNLLREAAYPAYAIEGKTDQWSVPVAARWIRNVLMGYPGILYDELTAATRLGVSLEPFQNSQLQNIFKVAKYKGVFSTLETRWWRNRLIETAQSFLLDQELRGPVFRNFAKAFELKFSQKLAPSICIVDGTSPADWVCHILRQPVKQSNSIPYYPDDRPAIMDQARVSFKAIQESNEFDENLVDADSQEIVESLWE